MNRRAVWSRGAPLAILAALAGCAGEPETASEAPEVDAPAESTAMAGELACQPMSGRMELEGRLSPYDSTRIQVGEQEALLCYGRPSARGREMIGGESVPYGQLWRTGANEPTTIHVPFAAEIAGVPVEPGTYTLYTVPGESEWEVVVNASTEQWGHESAYTPEVEAQEVGRGTVPVGSAAEYQETLTFSSETTADGANLVLEWEDTRVEIPIRARTG